MDVPPVKLNDSICKNIKPKDKTCKIADGGGLYLDVRVNGGRYWRYKYRIDGKEKLLSLGVYPEVSLKKALDKHKLAHELVSEGIDPQKHKREEKRIIRLMKAAHLYCKTKRKFKVTTNSKHNNPISPNLLKRQFKVSKPDQYWVGDITYIPTSKGWLYLATVIDLYSRQVAGWSMSNRMQASLVNDALPMAIWKRKPAKGLIWYTDRGSQYASHSHRKALKEHHIIQSMSRKGDCWESVACHLGIMPWPRVSSIRSKPS